MLLKCSKKFIVQIKWDFYLLYTHTHTHTILVKNEYLYYYMDGVVSVEIVVVKNNNKNWIFLNVTKKNWKNPTGIKTERNIHTIVSNEIESQIRF